MVRSPAGGVETLTVGRHKDVGEEGPDDFALELAFCRWDSDSLGHIAIFRFSQPPRCSSINV